MADEGGGAAHGLHDGGGPVGGQGPEIAPHGGIHPVDPLAAHLDGAAFAQGPHGPQDVGLRKVLDKLGLRGVILLQRLLGLGHDAAPPLPHRGNPVHASVLHRHIEPLQIQIQMLHDFYASFHFW